MKAIAATGGLTFQARIIITVPIPAGRPSGSCWLWELSFIFAPCRSYQICRPDPCALPRVTKAAWHPQTTCGSLCDAFGFPIVDNWVFHFSTIQDMSSTAYPGQFV